MEIFVSGEVREIENAETIERLLDVLGIEPSKKGIAVAKNATIVPRSRWETEAVSHGDRFEIVRASQGG